MLNKRSCVVFALAAILGGGLFLVGRGQQAEAHFGGCKLDGAWLLRFGDGLFYQTIVTDPLGRTGFFTLSPVVSNDTTLGGGFPDADSPAAGALGSIRRISRDAWEFSSISHGRRITQPDEPGGVVYIEVFEGIAELIDCDTEAATIASYRLYTADADADGDGFPDEGAEPIAVFEGLEGTAKRI